MGTRITQASFTRGELTPRLDSRTNLEQYGIGLKSAKNALIHQEGGISNRHGLEYCGIAKYSDKTTRLMKFVFNSEQTYMLEFGDEYIRVIKDGGYVIYPDDYGIDEGIETIYEDVYSNFFVSYRVFYPEQSEPYCGFAVLDDVDAENPELISLYANIPDDYEDPDTFTISDLIGMNVYSDWGCTQLYGYVESVDTDNTVIKITKEYHNEDEDKVALQGEIVEIESPYSADDVMDIKKSQSGDILTLTHPNYPTMNLSRLSHCDWELEEVILGSVIEKPTNVTATFSGSTPESNTKTYEYCVTAVDKKTNTESERSDVVSVVAHREANWTTSESITIRCDEILEASEYNIYRNVNGIFGYVGTAQAQENAVIVKNNVKFSGATTITNSTTGQKVIRITLSGGTYVYTKTLAKGNQFYSDVSLKTFYGTCTALTNTSKTKKITLAKRGMRFIDTNIEPDLSSSAPVVRNPFEDENYPSCSAYFQQRKVFANSKDFPQTIWASQTGTTNNFNVSRPLIATDAITLAMDDREMNEIRHLIPMKDLLVFTSNSEFKVNGTDGIFQASPMPAAVIQSCYGSSNVEPIISGDMVIFVQNGGSVIRDLGYDIMTEGYNGDELSLFSSHLFEGKKVVSMAYAKEPYRIVYVVFDDGTCASMVYNKKQKLCGWSRLVTDGVFKCVDVVREGLEDTAYFVIEREIDDNNVKFIERTRTRIINNAKDAFLVDCGLAQQFDEPKTTLPGLDWLEGKEIVVNADGGIIDNLTVVNGQVTLPREVTNVIVGLPYEFEIETLNIEGENTQGLKKVINHVSAKVYKTREDFEFVGADNIGFVNQRCYESILDSTKLFSKDIASTVISDAVTNATVKLRQKLPLPITVLSISAVVDVQDNENA